MLFYELAGKFEKFTILKCIFEYFIHSHDSNSKGKCFIKLKLLRLGI